MHALAPAPLVLPSPPGTGRRAVPTRSVPARPDRAADPALAAEVPTCRSVTAHVTGGLDGALRVVTMLRGRDYRVRDLVLNVREGVVESLLTCTVVLTSADLDLLVARLQRLPAVVSAEPV
jgi:hypothetical protein